MGAWIIKYTGTGRATCRECRTKIPKGERGLKVSGYQVSGMYCRRCILKMCFGIETKKQQDNALVLLELGK